MIDGKIKQKLLKELEKSGNVYLSCLKVGVDRSTFYRWRDRDKKFRKFSDKAINRGRENISDIAEHALLINVKEKKMEAIKYVLGHNSPRYKQKQTSNVVIMHKKDVLPDIPQKTLDDLLQDDEENFDKRSMELYERLTLSGKEIPNKLDGTPIELHELIRYESYITDWQKEKEKEKQKELKKEYIKLGIISSDFDLPGESTDKK